MPLHPGGVSGGGQHTATTSAPANVGQGFKNGEIWQLQRATEGVNN